MVVASGAPNDVDGDAAGVLSDRHVRDSTWVIKGVLLRHDNIAAIPFSSHSVQNTYKSCSLLTFLKCFEAEEYLFLFVDGEAGRYQRGQIKYPD